ncbi:MAG: YgiQ family radical SAM protein [Prevotellaceae bacterium]|nr:YgiQ family radical SAM protein [Prevotellaceae bacterium]
MDSRQQKTFLPTSKKELLQLGWDCVDVVLFSGDAYVDHPSFGAAVIGRVLEAVGLKVAIVPQPNWRDDFRDFKKMGKPRLFFAVSAGAMDSMVNHYTANRRLRSDDAYSPNGQAGLRPDYTTVVYVNILKKLYPDTPVLIGGIEASLRRFSHYDYWSDSFKRSVLVDSGADLLVYGMGEQAIEKIVDTLRAGGSFSDCRTIPQVAYLSDKDPEQGQKHEETIRLPAHESCAADKRLSAAAFRTVEEESNSWRAKRIIQPTGDRFVVVNPPFPPMTTAQLDRVHALPFTREPHPRYAGKNIPAFEMIRFSVNTHRGCFGGCAFCTISVHQGKFITSRSVESVLDEVRLISRMPHFSGYLTDLGGPSANMYQMGGKNLDLCKKCRRLSCIFPRICTNLNTNHAPLLALYKTVDALPAIKKSFIGSGIRYDLILHRTNILSVDRAADMYAEELIKNHVSGRLKVAPEHTSAATLRAMRKPEFDCFIRFNKLFDKINRRYSLRQQLVPYFISSHPCCTLNDMAELAVETKQLNFKLEQVQDFTPTPMTLATEMYHTSLDPYTQQRIYVARTAAQKLAQRQFFFWYKPEYRAKIVAVLRMLKRPDLITKLFDRGRG